MGQVFLTFTPNNSLTRQILAHLKNIGLAQQATSVDVLLTASKCRVGATSKMHSFAMNSIAAEIGLRVCMIGNRLHKFMPWQTAERVTKP